MRIENGKWKVENGGVQDTFLFPFSIRQKVTRRGLGVSAEQVLVKCKQQGTCVIVK